MRISDWSSDVCSSDLVGFPFAACIVDKEASAQREAFAQRTQVAQAQRRVAALADADHAAELDRLGVRQPRCARRLAQQTCDRLGTAHHRVAAAPAVRSEEHTSEITSLSRNQSAL